MAHLCICQCSRMCVCVAHLPTQHHAYDLWQQYVYIEGLFLFKTAIYLTDHVPTEVFKMWPSPAQHSTAHYPSCAWNDSHTCPMEFTVLDPFFYIVCAHHCNRYYELKVYYACIVLRMQIRAYTHTLRLQHWIIHWLCTCVATWPATYIHTPILLVHCNLNVHSAPASSEYTYH